MNLTEFLLARIAEDEEVARGATQGKWKLWGMSVMADIDGTSNVDTALGVAHTAYRDERGMPRTFDATHIARHDPARVLAECEAKRRIVEAYQKNRDRIEANATEHTRASGHGDLTALSSLRSVGWDLGGRDWALEIALRLLALPYADHPDYREEWRP